MVLIFTPISKKIGYTNEMGLATKTYKVKYWEGKHINKQKLAVWIFYYYVVLPVRVGNLCAGPFLS